MSVSKLQELLDEADIAMLVTETADGELRSRPMSIADTGSEGALWFVTGEDSGKLDEIERRPDVNLAISDDHVYVSVSGQAEVSNDRQRIRQMWSPAWEVWFSEGPEDPNIRLVKVTPSTAEYWDMSGMNRLQFIYRAGVAYLKDESLSGESVAGHGEVQFN